MERVMNEKNDNIEDIEEQEVKRLGQALDEAMNLLEQSGIGVAYKALVQIPRPETEPGRKMMGIITGMKMFLRGLKLYMEDRPREESKRALEKFLQEAPDDVELFGDKEEGLKLFRGVKEIAKALLIALKPEFPDITEEEQKQFDRANLAPLLFQVEGLQNSLKVLGDAVTALQLEREDEFASKMAQAETLLEGAEQEHPKMRDFFRSAFLTYRLMILTEQQLGLISQYDFTQARSLVVQSEGLQKELEQLHSNSAMPGLFPWGPEFGKVYHSLNLVLAELAGLIEQVVAGRVSAKTYGELNKLAPLFREVRKEATNISGPWRLLRPARERLLAIPAKGLRIINNLKMGMQPSRKEALSIAGVAAALGFISVVGLIFLIGSLSGVILNSTLVLSLGAFFGLVIGFGYGALRFQGFLAAIIHGGGDSTSGGED